MVICQDGQHTTGKKHQDNVLPPHDHEGIASARRKPLNDTGGFANILQFMQRAAAASPSPSDPATPDSHSNKRRKLSASPQNTPLSDLDRVRAALAEEESKRQHALEKQGLDAGETKWALSFHNNAQDGQTERGLRVISAGYASLDSSGARDSLREDETWRAPVVGRKVFGKFKGSNVSGKLESAMVVCC